MVRRPVNADVRHKKMKLRIIDATFIASSVILSHIVWTASRFVPIVYRVLFRSESEANIQLLMPAITRMASDFSFVFIGLISLAGFVSIILTKRRTANMYVLVGVAGQCLIAWIAIFCFSYDAFTGGMSLHHGPEFELLKFLSTAWGFFPISLVTLLIPFVGAMRALGVQRTEAEQAGPAYPPQGVGSADP